MTRKVIIPAMSGLVTSSGVATHAAIIDNRQRPWWKFWLWGKSRILWVQPLKTAEVILEDSIANLEKFTLDFTIPIEDEGKENGREVEASPSRP
jgi:hypothetical protein